MGHVAKANTVRCDVLDEIEAAITLKSPVRIWLEDGSHRLGDPLDLYTENHEDFVQLRNHLPIPLSLVVRVERV
ncbi:MAG: hypothetical protein AB1540_07550 [Bdellovibrionota bacterium]